jgi:flagellar M-ring protein FliF
MDVTLKRILTNLSGFWKNMTTRSKVLIIGGAAAIILLSVVLSTVINTTKYTQLFSGLSDSESGQVVSQLGPMGVKYKVEGSTIYVDSTKADETRMKLAESGFPQSTLTYSIYASGSTWAETDSDKKQKVLYQLQDRLEQTVNTIPGVSSSVVTIVDNQNDTYVLSTDKVKATASVKLNLSPGLKLTKAQISGIVQLVASSVPDLNKDDVTVLDSDGTQLNESSAGSGNTSAQLDLKNSIENEVKQKVHSVLDPVFGSGNVQVAAGATLDFDQTTTVTNKITAPSGSVSGAGMPSSQDTTTTVTGGTDSTGGVAGVNGGQTSQLPTYPTSSSSSSGTATQQSQQTSYLYDTVNQQIQSQGAAMTGLTIAVLLNNKSQNVSSVSTQDLTQIVARAVGIKDTTGISVQLIPFVTPVAVPTPAKVASPLISIQMIEITAVVLIILFVLFVIFMIMTRGKKRKTQVVEDDQEIAKAVPQRQALSSTSMRSIEDTIEDSNKNAIKMQIADFADDKPELVAQLLKNWLRD